MAMQTTVLTSDFIRNLKLSIVKGLYSKFPDKDIGKLSMCCYTEEDVPTSDFGESVLYVQIGFHDIKDNLTPWLIIRMYRRYSKILMFPYIDKPLLFKDEVKKVGS